LPLIASSAKREPSLASSPATGAAVHPQDRAAVRAGNQVVAMTADAAVPALCWRRSRPVLRNWNAIEIGRFWPTENVLRAT
jgi:hypothetical protein